MLFDSTFVNDLSRGRADADQVLDDLIEQRIPVCFSSLSVYEVGIGLRGEAKQYRDRFQEMCDEIEVVPFQVIHARNALSIQRTLYDRGEPIGAVDVLIAGTAAGRDETVLTRNVDEFERVDPITVETY